MPNATLDHLVVAANNLEAGVHHVIEALGVEPAPGGRHDYMNTHNAVLRLGPKTYLEIIAVDPDALADAELMEDKRLMERFFEELHEAGRTILMVTHERHVAKHAHRADHGVVVERDVFVVPVSQRIVLRPAAILVLGLQQVVNPSQGALSESLLAGGVVDPGQVPDLRVGGAVVDRDVAEGRPACGLLPANPLLLFFGEHPGHVDVFRPAAALVLIQTNVVRNAEGLLACVPAGVLIERVVPVYSLAPGLRLRRGTHGHRQEEDRRERCAAGDLEEAPRHGVARRFGVW